MAVVSGKERARLAREFDKQAANMQRQKESITRLSLMNTEAMAALFEVASHEGALDGMRERAQDAIARIERIRTSDVSGVTPLVLSSLEGRIAQVALGQYADEYATVDGARTIGGLVSRVSAATAPDQEESTGKGNPTASEELQT